MTDGFGRFTQIFQPQESLLDEQGMPVQTGLMGMNPTLLGLATGLLEAGAPTVGAPTPVSAGLSRGLTNAMAFQQAANQQAMQQAQFVRQQQEAQRQQQLMQRRQQALETLSGGDPRMMAALEISPEAVVGTMLPQEQDPTSLMQDAAFIAGPDATPEQVREIAQQRFMRPPSQTTVNIPPEAKRETRFQEKMGERDVRIFDELQSEANRAQESNLYVARSLQLMDEMETGALTPTTSMVRGLADAIGIEVDAERLGAEQAYRQVNTRFVLDQIAGMKGAISDREFATLSAAAPGLARTPAGNRFMLNMIRELNNRKVELARLQAEYLDDHGQLGTGWEKFQRRWVKENPMFTDDLRAEMQEAKKGRFEAVGENRAVPQRVREAPATIGGQPPRANQTIRDTTNNQLFIVMPDSRSSTGFVLVPARE